jgi:hypothetical protein
VSFVDVRIERLEAGWATISVVTNDSAYRIDASFVGTRDALEDLVHLGVSAKRSVPMEVWFEGEPQQWRLAIEPSDSNLISLTVHRFRGGVRRQPRDLGAPEFEIKCVGVDVARAIHKVFSTWNTDAADYEKRWYHAFPKRAFGLLEEALA